MGDPTDGDPTDVLDRAIEHLYAVFEPYPLRAWTEPCLHCHTEEDERALRRRPLRELEPQDLAGFASDSLMTWGETADFKHFLPRLFEIVAKERFPGDYPDVETVVGALERGGWRTWPPPEREATERFLLTLWQAHLASYPAHRPTSTVISAIATAVVDMTPYLEVWMHGSRVAPALHLAELVEENTTNGVLAGRLSNPWLRGRPDQEAQLRHWLLAGAPAFLPRLESTFLDATDGPTLVMLESAIDFGSRSNPL